MLKKIPPTLIPMPPPLARGALAFARQRNEENKTTPVLQTKKRMNSEIIFFFKIAMHPNLTQRQCFSVQNALLFIFFIRMPRDVSSIPAASFKIYPAPEF